MSTESTAGRELRPASDEHERDGAMRRIAAALRGLEFGTVTAVVQNGVVIQVERTEKVRLPRPARTR